MRSENTILQKEISKIAEKHELTTILEEVQNASSRPIKTKVAFLGEFSSGKTTLVNALMKERFLPMFDKPTTAIITEINRGETNKFEIIEEIDGAKEVKEIAAYEIAAEVQKAGAGRKLIVSLADSPIVDDRTTLIDTPGVSSINETHTDITYGYLEFVDVAFVVLNINTGSASNNLLRFLEQVPKDLLSKIFFILNFIDTKSEDQVVKLQEEFKQSLAKIIDEPSIYLTSAKKALQANEENDGELLKRSGIIPILKIITTEIPAFHDEVQEKRKNQKLQQLKDTLERGLKDMLVYMEYNEEEYFEQIEILKTNINELEKSHKRFKEELHNLEKSTRRDLYRVADNYTAPIIHKLNEGLDIGPETAQLSSEIEYTLRNKLKNIDNFEIQELGDTLAQNVSSNLKYNVGKKFSIANKIPGLLNSALLAAATGGAGLAVNTAEAIAVKAIGTGLDYAENRQKNAQKTSEAQQKTTDLAVEGKSSLNTSKEHPKEDNAKGTDTKGDAAKLEKKDSSSKWKKGLQLAANIAAQLNLIGELKDIAMEKTMFNKVNRSIVNSIDSQCNVVFAGVHQIFDEEMKMKFLLPLKTETESLASVRKSRDAEKTEIKENKEIINKDLLELKTL